MDTEQRLIELETRVAHQDQALTDLGDEIFRQQQSITALETQCRHLAERLRSLGEPAADAGPTDEVPPHY